MNLQPILQASYENNPKASELLSGAGYKLDESLSRPNAKVFTDSKGRPNIAFRGSRRWNDWLISDPLIALGLERFDPRYKEAQQLTKQVADKYGKKVDVFGHSLGSKVAELSGTNGHIYTFDKATGINDLFKTIPKNQYDVRTTNDIVSLGSITQFHPWGNFKEIEKPNQTILQAHDLSNLSGV
jgi:hypothetical protein